MSTMQELIDKMWDTEVGALSRKKLDTLVYAGIMKHKTPGTKDRDYEIEFHNEKYLKFNGRLILSGVRRHEIQEFIGIELHNKTIGFKYKIVDGADKFKEDK